MFGRVIGRSLSSPYNPLTNNVPHHIETSQLICRANQLADFYLMGELVVKGLKMKIRLT